MCGRGGAYSRDVAVPLVDAVLVAGGTYNEVRLAMKPYVDLYGGFAPDWKKPDGLFVIQPEEVDAFLLPPRSGGFRASGRSTKRPTPRLSRSSTS